LAGAAGAVAFFVIRRRRNDDDREEQVGLVAMPLIPEPSDEKLAKFEEILLEEGYRLVKAMTKYTQITESDKIASWMTTDFEFNGLTVDLIKSLISREVKLANHAGSLMRANSMASKMMKCLSGLIAKKYLKFLFQEIIEHINKNPTEGGCSFEVDPDKVPQGETLEANQKKLQTMCSKFLRRIFDNAEKAPLEFRQICNALQKRVSVKFPESSQTSVGGFLFLRVFCPAIVAPSGFGIVPTAPGGTAQRGLTLIAKTLQNVANNVTFGNKEEFMIWLNPFITSNFSACQDYFDEMATIPIDGNEGLVDVEQRKVTPEKREKALKDLYKHMKLLYPKMKDKYSGKDFFDRFYAIAKEDLEMEAAQKAQQQSQQGVTPAQAPQTNLQTEDV